MKKKMSKILRTGLMLVLAMTLALGTAAPVVADPADNVLSNVGPMAVAPDGTLYAAIHFGVDTGTDGIPDEWFWKVAKSDDNGYTWDDTEWDDIVSDEDGDMNGVVSIAVSPNYEEDELVYIGIFNDDPTTTSPPAFDGDPVVVRMEEAGEGDVINLKDFPSGEGVDKLWCIDVWTDEDDYNWIAAATDEDVYVLRDRLFEEWRLQELDTWASPNIDKGYTDGSISYGFDDGGYGALEVAFAPDFEESHLLWAIFADDDTTYGPHFWITATVSPGQWGQDVGDGWIDLGASPWLDMDFPDDYDSDDEIIVYAGLSDGGGNGAVWLIEGVDADDGFSNTIDLFVLSGDVDPLVDIVSIAVSGDYGDEIILAGEMWAPEIYISDDGGANWQEADKHPTGEGWTHVYMALGEFDPEEGVAYAATFGDESGVFRTDDGGRTWNPIVPPVPATIDIDPDTLNLKSKGKWITGYIELPEGYDVYDININTVVLNGEVPAESDPKYGFVKDPAGRIGDYDDDGIPDCMVKVDRSAVQGILGVGDAVEITVTGEVAGTPFEGSDIIRVK